jgi:glycerol uptake facilitator-like aquaporin
VVVRPLILFANISNNNKRLTNAKGGYRRRAIHPRPKETGFFAHLDKRAPQGFAPIAIGLGLTLIHLISIPVTNTSVNPARSTAVALFAGDWAISQLWVFWVAPIVGAFLAGKVYRWLESE